mmetsp:Transcript_26149/g.74859  ORF Transcript_26149/g.74859 Transcript_26149/m.74859 type:complete len:540 (+) Transcript_26149:482-2101(+)
MLEQPDALGQACRVGGHRTTGQHLDRSMQAPLAIVEVHGAPRKVTREVVAIAAAIRRCIPGGELQRLLASVTVLLPEAHVRGAGLVLLALEPAVAALQVLGLLNAALDLLLVVRRLVPHELAEPRRKENSIRIHLDDPIVVTVATEADNLHPQAVEDTGVQGGHPPPAIGNGQGAGDEANLHRGRLPTHERRGVAEDCRLVAPVDADTAEFLLLQEGGLVAERHHKREAVQRDVGDGLLVLLPALHNALLLVQVLLQLLLLALLLFRLRTLLLLLALLLKLLLVALLCGGLRLGLLHLLLGLLLHQLLQPLVLVVLATLGHAELLSVVGGAVALVLLILGEPQLTFFEVASFWARGRVADARRVVSQHKLRGGEGAHARVSNREKAVPVASAVGKDLESMCLRLRRRRSRSRRRTLQNFIEGTEQHRHSSAALLLALLLLLFLSRLAPLPVLLLLLLIRLLLGGLCLLFGSLCLLLGSGLSRGLLPLLLLPLFLCLLCLPLPLHLLDFLLLSALQIRQLLLALHQAGLLLHRLLHEVGL